MPKAYGTPGPRILSPDCCTSQSLSECSLGAQLLFDRLLVQSDDQGRQQADAAVVKATCFPLAPDATPKRIAAWLAELERAGMVTLYHSGKVAIVQLRGWWKYQSGARRAYPSRWDPPEGWTDRVFGVGKDSEPPADSGQGAGNLPAERGQSAPDFPPRARGSGTGTSTSAVTDAGTGAGARNDVFDAMQSVEDLTGRPFGWGSGSQIYETLAADVRDLGVERVTTEYRSVKAAAGSTPIDPAGIVFGAHKRLFPIPDGPAGKKGAIGKGGVSAEEAERAFSA